MLDTGLPWLSDLSPICLDSSRGDLTIDPTSNRYTAVGMETESYDAAGNHSSNSNGYAYSWDEEERLFEVTIDGTYT